MFQIDRLLLNYMLHIAVNILMNAYMYVLSSPNTKCIGTIPSQHFIFELHFYKSNVCLHMSHFMCAHTCILYMYVKCINIS